MRVIISVLGSLLLLGLDINAGPIYAGNGGHPNADGSPLSINNGWLITIDQVTGTVTPIGLPAGTARLSGLAFLDSNTLYGSTIGGNSCSPNCPFPGPPNKPNTSRLIQINPDTGALIFDKGPITAGNSGLVLAISDLSFQPGTGMLYGLEAVDASLSNAPAGNLYKINTQTAVATLVGNTGVHNGSIAFASDGTLYLSSTDVDSDDNFVNTQISRVNTMTAALLSSIPTSTFYTSLGYRASDGLLVGGDGDFGNIFAINPSTGQVVSSIANTGLNFVGRSGFPSGTGAVRHDALRIRARVHRVYHQPRLPIAGAQGPEARAALRVAGKKIRKLNFGRSDTPVHFREPADYAQTPAGKQKSASGARFFSRGILVPWISHTIRRPESQARRRSRASRH